MANEPAPPREFDCVRCGQVHGYGEAGFNWPDAVFALSLTEDERNEAQAGDGEGNEDAAVVKGNAFFVRGVAPISVKGWADAYQIGFWIQLAAEDFEDFERRGRIDHPVYSGRIANQSDFLGPTLGLEAQMAFVERGMRPRLRITDETSPLAAAAVDPTVVVKWMSDNYHDGEPEPPRAPFIPTLDQHGWRLVDPDEAGREPFGFDAPPAEGDSLKVVVQFVASAEDGSPTLLVAGWWVTVDDVRNPKLWSGVLDSHPRVPATIARGSRMWFPPSFVLEHAPRG